MKDSTKHAAKKATQHAANQLKTGSFKTVLKVISLITCLIVCLGSYILIATLFFKCDTSKVFFLGAGVIAMTIHSTVITPMIEKKFSQLNEHEVK